MEFSGILLIAGTAIYLLLIAYILFSLLRENRDPEITLAWILVGLALVLVAFGFRVAEVPRY